MVFTSIHPSLKPLLFSTQGPKPLESLAESMHPFQLPVHPSSFSHLSIIWVFILILECLFDRQVSETCKASYFHIRALRHIRSSLTTEACKTIAAINSRIPIDYCNSLLGWHICFKPGSPTACSKYTCPGSLLKNLAFAASSPFFLICIGFLFATE